MGRNIAAFGGDPGRVTLAGDSAGAMSAAIQSVLPGARERMSALALHSGLPRLTGPDEAAEAVERLAAELGVPVPGLADVRGDALITSPRFGPVAAGELADGLPSPSALPTLLATTADEGTFFLVDERAPREFTAAEATALAKALLLGDAPAVATRQAVTAAVTTALFDEPADRWAAAAAGPVWRTRYGRPSTLWAGWLGATHTLDVPVLFGTHRSPAPVRLFDGDEGIDEVSARLRRDFRSFLHRGAADWPQWTETNPVTRKVS